MPKKPRPRPAREAAKAKIRAQTSIPNYSGYHKLQAEKAQDVAEPHRRVKRLERGGGIKGVGQKKQIYI